VADSLSTAGEVITAHFLPLDADLKATSSPYSVTIMTGFLSTPTDCRISIANPSTNPTPPHSAGSSVPAIPQPTEEPSIAPMVSQDSYLQLFLLLI
jgi:hypothetical protein